MFEYARMRQRSAFAMLTCSPLPFPRRPYKVFANIPFNATAAIVNRLTQACHPPEDSYLVVRAEAAERFTGQPRGTLISTLLKPWFEPTLVHRFDRTDFDPPPRVDAVMLRLQKRGPRSCHPPMRACIETSSCRRSLADTG